VPFVQIRELERDARLSDRRGSRADVVVRLRVAGQSWRLVAEVKREGHPKQVRAAALRLNDIHAFIEARGAENLRRARRDLRSLFTPRAGWVPRALLEGPARLWKVAELSVAAPVSLGHVSSVRKRLVEEE